jgi:four helix bundle suffix protein
MNDERLPPMQRGNVCCYLLDHQLAAQAAAFEREGGFTERLFRIRTEKRRSH